MTIEDQVLLDAYHFFLDLMRVQGRTVAQATATLYAVSRQDVADAVVARWHRLVADQVDQARNAVLIKGLGAADAWYPGPAATDRYWPSLREHLLNHPKRPWRPEDVDALDAASTHVLASCRSPWDEESSGRGLVVGHVQSGKTTNFTAVIAKAADAGFRLFIVLSGTTRSLRHQTQQRLEEQLKDLNKHAWYFHTTLDGDIGSAVNWVPFLDHRNMRTCIVVKKNKKRLQNLNKSLDEAVRQGYLAECPILVIDDEGDNASISPTCDPRRATAINKQIVKAITRPRVTYVAYTATPFANCFVDPTHSENLYPRDFIYGLPEPEGYFGSRRLHGVGGEPDVETILEIPEDEVDGYLRRDPGDQSGLERAVHWFLLAATVRRLRNGGAQPHTTMLVNISEKIQVHEFYWQVVRRIVRDLAERLGAGDVGLSGELARLWDDESARVDSERFGQRRMSWPEIEDSLMATIDLLGPLDGNDHRSEPDCAIVVDNSESAHRLAYNDDQPRPVIVIGGNTLSRGLTLEGLVSTFFLRSTRLYDTLLQMGRWYGYRASYEDLFRIWMPRATRERFEFLARIEVELREWIAVFAATGMTPLEFGPRFRMHPQMQITRAALMRRARVERLDLAGTQPEVTCFENSDAMVGRNQAALRELATRLIPSAGERNSNGHLFRDVDAALISDFFDVTTGLHIAHHPFLRNDLLVNYITKKVKRGELLHWNVLLKGTADGPTVEFLPDHNATLIVRSRKAATGQIVDIGSLAAGDDKWADVPPSRAQDQERYRAETPLLAIYVIDKDSVPDARAAKNGRAPLKAVDHLVGVALFLPQSDHDDDLGDFACPPGPWDAAPDAPEVPEPDPEIDDEDDAAPVPPTSGSSSVGGT